MNIRAIMRPSLLSFIVILSVVLSMKAFAQSGEVDVITMKDGRKFIGTILERIEGKTVVLETKEGTEILDEKEIKEITKDFYPAVEGFLPTTVTSGGTLTLYGSFPAKKRSSDKIYIGSVQAEVRDWSANAVIVVVPKDMEGRQNVMLQSGSRSIAAPAQLTVVQDQWEKKKEIEDAVRSKNNLSAVTFMLGYIQADKEMAANTGPTSGYGSGGFIDGVDGRTAINSFMFIPLHWQLSFLLVDEDKSGETKSTDDMYFMSWLGSGFGLALPLGEQTFIGASYDVSVLFIRRPGFENDASDFKMEASSAVTLGTGYHVFLTIDNSVTFGMKFISAQPKFSFDSKATINGVSDIMELEVPVAMRFFYFGFSID